MVNFSVKDFSKNSSPLLDIILKDEGSREVGGDAAPLDVVIPSAIGAFQGRTVHRIVPNYSRVN